MERSFFSIFIHSLAVDSRLHFWFDKKHIIGNGRSDRTTDLVEALRYMSCLL